MNKILHECLNVGVQYTKEIGHVIAIRPSRTTNPSPHKQRMIDSCNTFGLTSFIILFTLLFVLPTFSAFFSSLISLLNIFLGILSKTQNKSQKYRRNRNVGSDFSIWTNITNTCILPSVPIFTWFSICRGPICVIIISVPQCLSWNCPFKFPVTYG